MKIINSNRRIGRSHSKTQYPDANFAFIKTSSSLFTPRFQNIYEPPETRLKGIVTDKPTGAPIKNARITATPDETDETNPPLVTATNAACEYSFKPIIVDDHAINATATSYQLFEDDEFHAALGDVNHFDIELVK